MRESQAFKKKTNRLCFFYKKIIIIFFTFYIYGWHASFNVITFNKNGVNKNLSG